MILLKVSFDGLLKDLDAIDNELRRNPNIFKGAFEEIYQEYLKAIRKSYVKGGPVNPQGRVSRRWIQSKHYKKWEAKEKPLWRNKVKTTGKYEFPGIRTGDLRKAFLGKGRGHINIRRHNAMIMGIDIRQKLQYYNVLSGTNPKKKQSMVRDPLMSFLTPTGRLQKAWAQRWKTIINGYFFDYFGELFSRRVIKATLKKPTLKRIQGKELERFKANLPSRKVIN